MFSDANRYDLFDITPFSNILHAVQFRIHDSHRVLVSLYIPTHPIIEDCSDMIFSSYPTTLPDASYTRAGWDRRENQYIQIEDFNWHKKTPSPHWRVTENAVPLESLNQTIQPGLLDNTLLESFLKLIHF